MCSLPDPFVKIQLVHGLKLTKTKKTSCMRGTIDPFYNESFSFKVPQEELENASLVFTGKSAVVSAWLGQAALVGVQQAACPTLGGVPITGVPWAASLAPCPLQKLSPALPAWLAVSPVLSWSHPKCSCAEEEEEEH